MSNGALNGGSTSSAMERLSFFGLRLLIAAIFLWHGFPKATDFAAASEKFVEFGLPGFLGPVTGIVEVVAGIALLLGLMHRLTVATLIVIILGALVTVQIPGGITAGLERDLMILLGLFVLFATGPGAYAVGGQR